MTDLPSTIAEVIDAVFLHPVTIYGIIGIILSRFVINILETHAYKSPSPLVRVGSAKDLQAALNFWSPNRWRLIEYTNGIIVRVPLFRVWTVRWYLSRHHIPIPVKLKVEIMSPFERGVAYKKVKLKFPKAQYGPL